MISRAISLEKISNPIQIIHTFSFSNIKTENQDSSDECCTTFSEEENENFQVNENENENEETSDENLMCLPFINPDLEILKKDSWTGFFCRIVTIYCNRTLNLTFDSSIFSLFF